MHSSVQQSVQGVEARVKRYGVVIQHTSCSLFCSSSQSVTSLPSPLPQLVVTREREWDYPVERGIEVPTSSTWDYLATWRKGRHSTEAFRDGGRTTSDQGSMSSPFHQTCRPALDIAGNAMQTSQWIKINQSINQSKSINPLINQSKLAFSIRNWGNR